MAPHPIWLASLYKKEIWTHRLQGVHTQRQGHVRIQQEGKASTSQGEKPSEKPNLLTPWLWTSSLQHCGKDWVGQKVCSGSLPNTFLLSYRSVYGRYFVKAAPANEHRDDTALCATGRRACVPARKPGLRDEIPVFWYPFYPESFHFQ